jgi:hypothetical protein
MKIFKTHLINTGFEDVDWIHLAQMKAQKRENKYGTDYIKNIHKYKRKYMKEMEDLTLPKKVLNYQPKKKGEMWDNRNVDEEADTGDSLIVVRFQVITTASMKFRVFWDVAPCSHVEVDSHFRGAYCLHHQGDGIDD